MDDIPEKLLTRILQLVPLCDRLKSCARVSSTWCRLVKETIEATYLYAAPFATAHEEMLLDFFDKYGGQMEVLNFDMFRAFLGVSQGKWRHLVCGIGHRCPNITSLEAVFSFRHKLRDKDLMAIFESCPNLRRLVIDASFVSGHCFRSCPSLEAIELEAANRITNDSLISIANRSPNLRVFYMSGFEAITNRGIKMIAEKCTALEDVAFVATEADEIRVTTNGIQNLLSLPRLRRLLLEGLSAVTDRFLDVLTQPSSACRVALRSLGLPFSSNVSSRGIQHLSRLPALTELNLDGITRRDISEGLKAVGNKGRMITLLLARDARVSNKCVARVLERCSSLRVLDLTDNDVVTQGTAEAWLKSAVAGARKPLVVVSGCRRVWLSAPIQATLMQLARDRPNCAPPLRVVDPDLNTSSNTSASDDGDRAAVPLPQSHLQGLFSAGQRRGNRYRLIAGEEFSDDSSDLDIVDALRDMGPDLFGDAWDDGVAIGGGYFKNGYLHMPDGDSDYIGDSLVDWP